MTKPMSDRAMDKLLAPFEFGDEGDGGPKKSRKTRKHKLRNTPMFNNDQEISQGDEDPQDNRPVPRPPNDPFPTFNVSNPDEAKSSRDFLAGQPFPQTVDFRQLPKTKSEGRLIKKKIRKKVKRMVTPPALKANSTEFDNDYEDEVDENNEVTLDDFYNPKPSGTTVMNPSMPSVLRSPDDDKFTHHRLPPNTAHDEDDVQIRSPEEIIRATKSNGDNRDPNSATGVRLGANGLKSYGGGASKLFRNKNDKSEAKQFSKMSDPEKLGMDSRAIKELSSKNLTKLFKLARDYHAQQKGLGNDKVRTMRPDKNSASPAILVAGYQLQAENGNYKKRYKKKAKAFEPMEDAVIEMWKGLKGMKKKAAQFSYVELIQTSYSLVPTFDTQSQSRKLMMEAKAQHEKKMKDVMAQPLGNSATTGNRSAFRSLAVQGIPKKDQSVRQSEKLMRICSVQISKEQAKSIALPPAAKDQLQNNIEQYRKTITRDEFDRFSVMKIRKMDIENQKVAEKLQSMQVNLNAEDLAQFAKNGAGFDTEQIQSIRLAKFEVTGRKESLDDDKEDETGWSISGSESDEDSQGGQKKVAKKKVQEHNRLANRPGPHQEIPRQLEFRNSLAPYNSVRKIIDKLEQEVREMTRDNLGYLPDGFSGQEEPEISLGDYMFRLARYMDSWFYEAPAPKSVGCRSLVMALMFLYRLSDLKDVNFVVTKYNAHRLYAACTLIAAKFYEDYIVSHSYWSEVCGIPAPELNKIEELLCNLLQYNFFVTEHELTRFYKKRQFPEY